MAEGRKPYAGVESARLSGSGERLREAVDSLKSRKYAAEEVMNVSVDALARYLREENEPTFRAIARLALHAGFSMEWLATGAGPKQLSVAEKNADAYGGLVAVSRVEVEAGRVLERPAALSISRSWLQRHALAEAALVVIAVRGGGMESELAEDDLVLVDRRRTQIVSGSAYGLRLGSELLVRFLQNLPEGQVQVIAADRERFPPVVYAADSWRREAEVIGRVCGRFGEWG